MLHSTPLVDAHLDLSYNALRGRDVTLAADQQATDEEGIPTVGLPDLRRAPVAAACATIFVAPSIDGQPGYRSAVEARSAAIAQLDWYRAQQAAGRMRLIQSQPELAQIAPSDASQAAILLMEGADPITSPRELDEWFAAGLRIVGLAWKRTRYAGGTGAPGPLTAEGVGLVGQLDRLGIIHDLSHLAEESFWQLLDISRGGVIASHSNCRSIVPTDRQLSDAMIRAIAARDGVIGINFYDKFLVPPGEYGARRATLADVVAHITHICQLLGEDRHVGLGTDMDGGLGRDQIPIEIRTSADLPRVADALADAGYSDASIAAIMGENWMTLFARLLPEGCGASRVDG